MANFTSGAVQGFAIAMNVWGQPIRLRYFSETVLGGGSYFDDKISLTVSGTDFWTSGVVQTIDGPNGRNETLLMEQGRLLDGDLRLYTNGNLFLQGGSASHVKIGVGSPVQYENSINDGGVHWFPAGANGLAVYKKIYMRPLPAGSLPNE